MHPDLPYLVALCRTVKRLRAHPDRPVLDHSKQIDQLVYEESKILASEIIIGNYSEKAKAIWALAHGEFP
ncbi:MAG: hypothetical protein WC761_00905 [Candidatus Paceibacterota bacterium]|jgi:hypothetical protein